MYFRQAFDNSYFNEPEFNSHNGLIVSIITKDDDILKNMVYSLDILYRMISLDPYPIFLILSTMDFMHIYKFWILVIYMTYSLKIVSSIGHIHISILVTTLNV